MSSVLSFIMLIVQTNASLITHTLWLTDTLCLFIIPIINNCDVSSTEGSSMYDLRDDIGRD